LDKTNGIKARCHWEHIENLMGTHWELDGNMLRTGKNEKKSSPQPLPHPKLKRKRKIQAP